MNTSNLRHSFSRDQVLIAHAVEMIARTSFSQDDFAAELSKKIHLTIPDKGRAKDVPDFAALGATNDTKTFMKESGNWLRRVNRWLSGEVELASWIEEPWVLALDAEHRERCINELASRHGLIGARASGGDAQPVTAFAQFVTRMGQAIESGSEVLADGVIDDADLPLLPAFIDGLRAVESRAFELRSQAESALAQGNTALRRLQLA
jgi:hypothetical protein